MVQPRKIKLEIPSLCRPEIKTIMQYLAVRYNQCILRFPCYTLTTVVLYLEDAFYDHRKAPTRVEYRNLGIGMASLRAKECP